MIDFHCHLDLYSDLRAPLEQCARLDMDILSVTTTPSAWRGTRALAASLPRIRTALGLHPELAHERYGELALFDNLIGEARYIGEIGLDHSAGSERTWEIQSRVLRHVLSSCERSGGRIMSLHSRRAAREVLDHLEEAPGAGVAVLHWLSCTARELERAVALGCWFSVGPAMLRGAKGRDLVSRMPRDRVLTESDGPFAQIAGRAATPGDVAIALDALAQLWSMSKSDVDLSLASNFRRLVGHVEEP